MDWEDIVVFAFVLLGFFGVVGSMRLMTYIPRLWRMARTFLLMVLVFIDSSIAERVCRSAFHDLPKGAIWTRVFLITLVSSATYIFALIASQKDHPVMSPKDKDL